MKRCRCPSVRLTPSYAVYNKEFGWSLFLVPGRKPLLTLWNFLNDMSVSVNRGGLLDGSETGPAVPQG